MHRITILVHDKDTFKSTGYFLHRIATLWHQQGFQLSVQQGLGRVRDVDLAIMHVDRTVTPEPYRKMIAQYPRVLNGKVFDISKRAISRSLVRPGDGYDGPVIVKTNHNYGGIQELKDAGTRVDERLKRSRLRYHVLPSPAEVPKDLWHDPVWVVERFICEKAEDLYCLRTWMFLGDQETNSLCYSPEPIVKSRNIVRRERIADVPAELRERRRQLGFDFGKFDYAIVDGEVILYDANRTPSLGNFQPEIMMPTIELLARGIHCFL
jgi:hypothetical protein